MSTTKSPDVERFLWPVMSAGRSNRGKACAVFRTKALEITFKTIQKLVGGRGVRVCHRLLLELVETWNVCFMPHFAISKFVFVPN